MEDDIRGVEVTPRMLRNDSVLAAALLALACFGLFIARDVFGDEAQSLVPAWADYVLTVALVSPLALRRKAPLWVCAWVGVIFPLYRVLKVPEASISSATLFIAIFGAGAYSWATRRDTVRGGAIVLGFLTLGYSFLSDGDYINFDAISLVFFSIGLNAAFFVAAWMLGDAFRIRRENEAVLARQAEELRAERAAREEAAVVAERVRIARELHDVVAHHVSVMGVQAGAARRTLESDPATTRDLLSSIEESGRTAVRDLQRSIGMLRGEDRPESSEPQPTLADIDRLVEQRKELGQQIRVQRIGAPKVLPEAAGLSAFRVVQEALTNISKHAGDAPTDILLTYGTEGLQVEVVNQPPAQASPASSSAGRGLTGMRERTAMLGGRFESGVTRIGGYRVSAWFPYETAET